MTSGLLGNLLFPSGMRMLSLWRCFIRGKDAVSWERGCCLLGAAVFGRGCCLLGAAAFGMRMLSPQHCCIWVKDVVSSASLHLARGCCLFGAKFRSRVLSLPPRCISPPFLFAFLVSGECVSVQTPGLCFEIYIHPGSSICGVLWNR